MTLDFGNGPDRLKRWAAYILTDPNRWGADALRVARAITSAADNVRADEARIAAAIRERERSLL